MAHGGSLGAGLKVLLEIPAQRNPFNLEQRIDQQARLGARRQADDA